MFNLLFGSSTSKKRPRSESSASDGSEAVELEEQLSNDNLHSKSELATPSRHTQSNATTTPNALVGSPIRSARRSTLSAYRSFRNDVVFEERVTLAQKLTKVVPDAEINSPHVIIVGGQTAGKTKLIISLVFYHLIDNSHFTDHMGELILKIFRTGTRMVTRRPTTINFSKSDKCKITINLGLQTAVYPSPEFLAIIEFVSNQSKDEAGHAYEDELRVFISAPGLPNRTFTDLPGLVTRDRQLRGSDKSISSMVGEYLKNPTTTVVVVEPASTEDFETSQISPLLRDISLHSRPDIFNNSVLVLSKCDKIRDGLEGDIMDKIDLSSPQLKEFPYRHVVGVINKIEGEDDQDNLTFAEFKDVFRETKDYERNRFSAFLNRDHSPCSVTTQCTTSAVFNKMEQISFSMVYRSIEDGILSLDLKIEDVQRQIKARLAPPIEFYDHIVAHQGGADEVPVQQMQQSTYSSSHSGETFTEDGSERRTIHPRNASIAANEVGYSRMTFIEEFRANFDEYLSVYFESLAVFPSYGAKISYIEQELGGWPQHKHNSISVSKQQRLVFKQIEDLFHAFLEDRVRSTATELVSGSESSCLSKEASPFHRIDRFPNLCKKIRGTVQHGLHSSVKKAKAKVSAFLSHKWEYAVPSGLSKHELCELLDALQHVCIRSMHDSLTDLLDAKTCFGLEDGLFIENDEFSRLRAELQDRPFQLKKQRDILTVCLGVSSNDELREALERSSGSDSNNNLTGLLSASVDLNPFTGSSSSSSSGQRIFGDLAALSEAGSRDHWRDFWVAASIEATLLAQEQYEQEENARVAAEREALEREEQRRLEEEESVRHSQMSVAEQQDDSQHSSFYSQPQSQPGSQQQSPVGNRVRDGSGIGSGGASQDEAAAHHSISDEMMIAAAEQAESQASIDASSFLGTPGPLYASYTDNHHSNNHRGVADWQQLPPLSPVGRTATSSTTLNSHSSSSSPERNSSSSGGNVRSHSHKRVKTEASTPPKLLNQIFSAVGSAVGNAFFRTTSNSSTNSNNSNSNGNNINITSNNNFTPAVASTISRAELYTPNGGTLVDLTEEEEEFVGDGYEYMQQPPVLSATQSSSQNRHYTPIPSANSSQSASGHRSAGSASVSLNERLDNRLRELNEQNRS